MYDIKRRSEFSTVGELKKLLEACNDDSQVLITGDSCCWFHIEKDDSVICLDCEDLEDCYEE